MKAYLILVGSELLNGAMIDTNSIYMAEKLNEIGVEVVGKIFAHDKIEDIKKSISYAKKNADLVILSGGLGPTIDDLTKEAIGEYLGKILVVDELHKKEMERKFAERGIKVLSKNLKEVSVIEGSEVFYNEPGIAPAFFIENISAFPGVPMELKNMFPKYLTYIKEKFKLNEKLIVKDYIVWGIPESLLEEKIKDYFTDDRVFLEFLVKDYGIVVRMVTEEKNSTILNDLSLKLQKVLGDSILYEGYRPSEEVLVKKLLEKGLKISLGESCTGGMITEKIVSVSGASGTLVEGIVTYSNESKVERLRVKEETLNNYGAVSEETVKEMLEGLKTSVGIAVSGVAGPLGGTEEKPVGTVYIGIKLENEFFINKYLLKGDRERIRIRACYTAINNLLQILEKRGCE
ncbi:MAG: CinA family nicotinamide mononucleotide deamidase-related protein [Fusobacteriaceae bacterium]|nr:CinA family nicotinamide mononucleotide deamidase-related protein [Fusobacteriaceae bacterium]MBN2839187.1 CinA family nicotinamide mononucleotide deamidase-related protein [Fusobacteriaceae bacterium]